MCWPRGYTERRTSLELQSRSDVRYPRWDTRCRSRAIIMLEKRAMCSYRRQVQPLLMLAAFLVGVRTEIVGEFGVTCDA